MVEPTDHLSARGYAERLHCDLGAVQLERPLNASHDHPVVAWARSGAMELTGLQHGPPQVCPVPLASAAQGAWSLVDALSLRPLPEAHDGARLLGERAAIAGHRRQGGVSPGGACRLLRAADGLLALNLARDADWDLMPAWLEDAVGADWTAVARAVAAHRAADLVERGRELGLALAALDDAAHRHAPAFEVQEVHDRGASTPDRRPPRVLDLSALWAGPLCAHLLQLGGAEVVKFESRTRPDGARAGPPAFFDLLNAGKRSAALDLREADGRARLLALLRGADIVIESSRPRALHQLGIDAQALLRERAGLTWIALSGHGRGEPQSQWIAYGDDAGVEGGLSRVMHRVTGEALFVGDAIADPLAGLHAAALAWWSWRRGGSRLVAVSLSGVVRRIVAHGGAVDPLEQHARWCAHLQRSGAPVETPRARIPAARAAGLGAHTADVEGEWTS